MPFGEYESWEDCIEKNKGKDDPEAYCATIKRAIEGASVQTGNQNLAVFSEPLHIIEDTHCCLKVNAVIAKEGVYDFPAGTNGETKRCLWSRSELQKAARTARTAKITILDHPPNRVVTAQEEIYGQVEKAFYDRDRIRSTLNFEKDVCPADFLEEIRAAAAKTGPPKDVSIGFYYVADETPGKWHDQNYDLVMRNIVIDHVATGVQKGRCSYPDCGVGVSSVELAAFMNASKSPEKKPPATSDNPPPPPPPPAETTPSPTPPAKPAPMPSTDELLTRSTSLLRQKQQRDIEREKERRRHPA
jgi:hypothetical protein